MDAATWVKMVNRGEYVAELFSYFWMHQWIYDSSKIEFLEKHLNEEEKKIFFIDVAKMNPEEYFFIYNWGVHRFLLGENVEPPDL